MSTWPLILAAPTARLVERAAPLLLKSVVYVPSTSCMVARASLVMAGCSSVTWAVTSMGFSRPASSASLRAASVPATSTTRPGTESVMTNCPFSLVIDAFRGSAVIPWHCVSTKALTLAESTSVSSSISTGAAARSFSIIYCLIRLPPAYWPAASSIASVLIQ